jgi:hypothetical protein
MLKGCTAPRQNPKKVTVDENAVELMWVHLIIINHHIKRVANFESVNLNGLYFFSVDNLSEL